MSEYKVALIGFGGVNRALAQLAADNNAKWQSELGFQLKIVGISDLHLGSVVRAEGIDLNVLRDVPTEKGALAKLPGGNVDAATEQVIETSGADIVAEATFTNAVNGEPATSYCRLALSKGISVVTTNKGPVAFHAEALKREAAANGAHFEYEGSVMSGTPVIRLAKELLAGSELKGFEGILNGTSNFVLSSMESGLSFTEAVEKAQRLGYAEADPTADIEGHDVRLKVVILANELLGAKLKPADVSCKGISGLTLQSIHDAAAANARWKLIGSASKLADGTVRASVEPKLLPLENSLAAVGDAINAVTFRTGMLGDVTVRGPGAGRVETAYALLADIISIHKAKVAQGK
ncbi:homoserine dehydrogenase [Burkholderia lata]|uniref:homoserine dehydrogenase n=1 Tax=Burkholderia lata (strain ATCC 17760 / DSM 23089 / LMG 22485 / NCIMB 9086 / R18194 / 383) TaxID=482957 RepID=UPI0008422932|nr:homoserine dehydrogenase [Burkholderia lata]AOJ42454.1 homoserine dehydrogenase [Burkholderia lata]